MNRIHQNIQIHPDILMLGTTHEEPIITDSDPEITSLYFLMELLLAMARDAGRKEGYAMALSETTSHVQSAQKLLETIPNEIVNNRLSFQKDIADIVITVLQELFIQQPPGRVELESKINRILTTLHEETSIEIHLHPDDIHVLQSNEMQLHTSQIRQLKIKPQKSLLPGDCRIHSTNGVFQISLDNQIQQLRELLIQLNAGGFHANSL